jgi:ABC transporter substrate binding protein
MASHIGRRKFLATLLGSAAASWPLAARAQQPRERMRRIGMLLPAAPDDAEFQSWVGAFLQGLAQSGWITGRNIRIETRWTKFDPEETRKYAAELVALAPDVILAPGTSTVGPLLRLTRTVPIVFPVAADLVAAGLVESLARPGGNVTGFMSFEIGISVKWLELLKEIAPGVKRAAVLRSLAIAAGPGAFGAIQAVAPSLGVELRDRYPGRRGDRTRYRCIRQRAERRVNRSNGRGRAQASGVDRCSCGAAPAAGGLCLPHSCHERWPDLLRPRQPRPVPPRGRLR